MTNELEMTVTKWRTNNLSKLYSNLIFPMAFQLDCNSYFALNNQEEASNLQSDLQIRFLRFVNLKILTFFHPLPALFVIRRFPLFSWKTFYTRFAMFKDSGLFFFLWYFVEIFAEFVNFREYLRLEERWDTFRFYGLPGTLRVRLRFQVLLGIYRWAVAASLL